MVQLNQIEIVILGCGDAKGTPKLGCNCKVCRSVFQGFSKNKRSRSSVLFRYNNKNVLIDTPLEIKEQIIKSNIRKIDALLLTHNHADHVLGFEDFIYYINEINNRGYIFPIYGSKETLEGLRRRFSYLFEDKRLLHISLKLVGISESFDLFSAKIIPVRVLHGDYKQTVLGYIFNFSSRSIFYIPDGIKIIESEYRKIPQLDLLIIGVSRIKHLPGTYCSCFSLEQVKELVSRLRCKRCILTHIPHYLDFYTLKLPLNIRMGYDGMRIRLKLGRKGGEKESDKNPKLF
jgi:phosphoribosyl 1,2-cyclic phosphate phosphodiesterase